MSENTPNLNLPYILDAQAQKHVTHNEAIRSLDALTQLSIIDQDLNIPPVSPEEGSCYIIASSPTDEWTGRQGQIAAWQDGAWMYYPPQEGWRAWVSDEDQLLVYNGAAWVVVSSGGVAASLNPVTGGLVGVNATADTTNRLSVSSPASLFDHEGDDHQLKINKNAAGDTASVIFQTSYSGRAEFGLTGDDDFHMKVSPDGSTFHDGIIIDKDTGEVSFPNSSISGDEWGDAVDDDIIPDADGTRNLGADATRFAGGYVDNLYLTNGYRETGSIVIADDAVGEIDTPADGGFLFIGGNFYSEFTQSSMSSLLLYDAGSSLQTVEIWAGSLITIVNDASSYTGITGTDGRVTVGCGTDKIILENRTGGGRTFHYTFIGHPS